MSTPTLTSQPAASSPGAVGIEPAARSQRTTRDPESAEQFAAAVADVLTPTTSPGSNKGGPSGRAPSVGHRSTAGQPTDPTLPVAQPGIAATALAALIAPAAPSSTAVVPTSTGPTPGAPTSPELSAVTGPVLSPVVGTTASPVSTPVAGQPEVREQTATTATLPAGQPAQGGGSSAAGVEATLIARQPQGPQRAVVRPPTSGGPVATVGTATRAEVPPPLTLVQVLSTSATPVAPSPGASVETKPGLVPVPAAVPQAQATGATAVATTPVATTPVVTTAAAGSAVPVEAAISTETMPRDLRHRGAATAAVKPTADAPSVQGPVPAQATLRTSEVAATAAASSSPVAAQVAHAIAPLRLGPDGSHVVTVVLHPAELGSVRVTVELREGAMHVQLSGGAVAVEALRSSLPDLRHQLEQLGTPATSIDVAAHGFNRSPEQQPGSGPGSTSQPEREPDQRARSRDPDPLPPHPPKPSAGRALLDLRM